MAYIKGFTTFVQLLKEIVLKNNKHMDEFKFAGIMDNGKPAIKAVGKDVNGIRTVKIIIPTAKIPQMVSNAINYTPFRNGKYTIQED